MQPKLEKTLLIEEAENYLNQLSTERLKLVVDFLAYLKQKEEEEATEELINIPGFENELREAEEEAKTGKLVSFDKIRRNV